MQYKGPICGNARIEEPETCDDGNRDDGDGCSRSCRLEILEICNNGIDDDGNGWIDCTDPACLQDATCTGEICGNGIDDDQNGKIDCEDVACQHHNFCRRDEICGNGIDDDQNEQTDCEDPVCNGHPQCGACNPTDTVFARVGDYYTFPRNDNTLTMVFPCDENHESWQTRFHLIEPAGARLTWQHPAPVFLTREEDPDTTCGVDVLACTTSGRLHMDLLPPGVYRISAPASTQVQFDFVEPIYENCSNGFDDDADGQVDCEDPDCANAIICQEEICNNGSDDNGDGLVDCEDPQCVVFCAPPEDCTDGRDNDLDGHADCQDIDCTGTPVCTGSSCVVHFDFGTLHRGAIVAADWSTAVTPNSFIASCGGAGPDFTAAFTLDAPSNVLLHLTQTGSHSLTLSTEAGPGTSCLTGELACLTSPGVHMPGTWSFSQLPAARYFVNIDATTEDATGMGRLEIQTVGPLDEWCANGIDDNGDGLADCADPQCSALSLCQPETLCRNDLDDDDDGWTDCADPDCMATSSCGPGMCIPHRNLGTLLPGHPVSAWVDLASGDLFSSPLPCAFADPSPITVLSFALVTTSRVHVRMLPELVAEPVAALSASAGPNSTCDAAIHQCAAVPTSGIQGSFETVLLPAGNLYYVLVSSYAAPALGRVQVILEAR